MYVQVHHMKRRYINTENYDLVNNLLSCKSLCKRSLFLSYSDQKWRSKNNYGETLQNRFRWKIRSDQKVVFEWPADDRWKRSGYSKFMLCKGSVESTCWRLGGQHPASHIFDVYWVSRWHIVLKECGLIYWDDLLVCFLCFYEFKFEFCLFDLKASFPSAS